MSIKLSVVSKALIGLSMSGLIAGSAVVFAGQADNGQFSHTAIEDLQWGPTPFGPEAAIVAGDFSSGQHITYIKFTAGMTTPMHIHSHDYVGLVISGTTKHWVAGQPKTQQLLPAGSHWSIPANVEHVSECLAGSDCVMAIYQDQAFDFVPVEK